MKHTAEMQPYRVGLGRDLHHLRRSREWWQIKGRLRLMAGSVGRRSWWGFWQVEWPGCQRAVRGLTADHALLRAIKQRGHYS